MIIHWISICDERINIFFFKEKHNNFKILEMNLKYEMNLLLFISDYNFIRYKQKKYITDIISRQAF